MSIPSNSKALFTVIDLSTGAASHTFGSDHMSYTKKNS